MSGFTRREAVGGIAGVSLAALAGCVGGDDGSGAGSEQPRLDRVRVGNARENEVSLDLQLELDGEVVFWRDVAVDGADGDGGTVTGPEFVPPAFPRERGEWRVRARVRDGGDTYTTVFTSETTAESCLALTVTVQPENVEVAYVATHECSDAPAAGNESA
jgi:hypothetical protein